LQIGVWLVTAVIFAAVASAFIPQLGGLTIPIGLITFGIVYFILGYLLFGIMMAGLGSIGSTARESSQWTTIVVLPAVIPLVLSSLIVTEPNGIVSTILTLFPLTAPITAIMKLGIASMPTWELLLSIAILIASILGTMWLASRVFRTFLLMYGKRPSFGEVWRYIREG
jgi:ABC-2 type transport system permease protein